jgi:tetratricopeptide (TPR) repeat protein
LPGLRNCSCRSGAKYKACCGRIGQEARRRAPSGDAAAHVNLGNALARRGRLEEALCAYRRAIALDPSSAELHNNLGSLLRGCGRLEQAVACFGRSLELKPDFVPALTTLAESNADTGDFAGRNGASGEPSPSIAIHPKPGPAYRACAE